VDIRIFISYRRDDSAGHTGRIHDRLEREFGRDVLFMDVDAIPLGTNFVKVIGEEVAKCDVLLAIIGPRWLDARAEDGERRLDNPHDFVRIEIAAALKRDIPVIPILLEGTRVPKAERLPHDLKDLALRAGLDVRHASFHSDMEKLILSLRDRKPTKQAASTLSSGADAIDTTQTSAQRHATGHVWDKTSLFEKLARAVGQKEMQIANQIYEWMRKGGKRRVKFGVGQEGSVYPILTPSGIRINPVYLSSNGKLYFQFGSLKDKPVFGTVESRRALMTRINEIPDVGLTDAELQKYPGIPLNLIAADPDGLTKIMSVLHWIDDQLEEHERASSGEAGVK
jgi:TIR domain